LTRVCIADLGCGNVGSVTAAFERLGASVEATSDQLRIEAAERLVLPGVGAAAFAMERLRSMGLISVIRSFERPLMGICLGMQLLFASSEEGETDCLGLIDGKVRRLEPLPGRRIPHMGWSRLSVDNSELGLRDGDYVWFAHSFACDDGPYCTARADVAGPVPAVVRKANLLGCQFHPERSGEPGSRFLKKFLEQ
jgi:glutamine amidotransferase